MWGAKEAFLGIAVSIGLAACGSADEPATESPGPSGPREAQLLDGESAYNEHCASCHRDGAEGAPVTGDSAYWADRSPLWMAVLSEHAMDGYLQMPARGGDPTMSDAEVQAATEHMMLLTYPDLPRD